MIANACSLPSKGQVRYCSDHRVLPSSRGIFRSLQISFLDTKFFLIGKHPLNKIGIIVLVDD